MVSQCRHVFSQLRMQAKMKFVRKTQGPKNPNGVFGQSHLGIANHPNQVSGDIALTIDIVNDLLSHGIIEKSITGEIPTVGILFGGPKDIVSERSPLGKL